jgi:uncharacterized membrane protein
MAAKTKRMPWVLRVLRARIRLTSSILLGTVIALVLPSEWAWVTQLLIAWDAGVLCYLVAVAVLMAGASSREIKRHAPDQDEGAIAILALTVIAVSVSLVAIFIELAAVKRSVPHYPLYLALAIATVALSWVFTHTMFARHYAHEFYGEHARANGLRFLDKGEPDYWDFMYFSFVIGMTFQVSDIAVTNKWIRRTVGIHGVLSFFFTTTIVALTVNIAANIIQR